MALQPVAPQALLPKVPQLATCLARKAAPEWQLVFVVWCWQKAVGQVEVKTLFEPCSAGVPLQAPESHGHIVESIQQEVVHILAVGTAAVV